MIALLAYLALMFALAALVGRRLRVMQPPAWNDLDERQALRDDLSTFTPMRTALMDASAAQRHDRSPACAGDVKLWTDDLTGGPDTREAA